MNLIVPQRAQAHYLRPEARQAEQGAYRTEDGRTLGIVCIASSIRARGRFWRGKQECQVNGKGQELREKIYQDNRTK